MRVAQTKGSYWREKPHHIYLYCLPPSLHISHRVSFKRKMRIKNACLVNIRLTWTKTVWGRLRGTFKSQEAFGGLGGSFYSWKIVRKRTNVSHDELSGELLWCYTHECLGKLTKKNGIVLVYSQQPAMQQAMLATIYKEVQIRSVYRSIFRYLSVYTHTYTFLYLRTFKDIIPCPAPNPNPDLNPILSPTLKPSLNPQTGL